MGYDIYQLVGRIVLAKLRALRNNKKLGIAQYVVSS